MAAILLSGGSGRSERGCWMWSCRRSGCRIRFPVEVQDGLVQLMWYASCWPGELTSSLCRRK